MPDAPGGPQPEAGQLPEMRHGARPRGGRAGRRHGAARHEAPLLGEPRAERPGRRAGDAAASIRRSRLHAGGAALERARPARACDTRRPVVRLAVLPQVLAVAHEPQPEHVHPHRPRRRPRLPVQRHRGGRARSLPAGIPGARRRGRRVFRGRGRDRHPGAVRRSPAAARHRRNQPGDPQAACACAQYRAAPRARRARGRGTARPGAGGRQAARPTGREGSCRWNVRRGLFERGRVHDHRRAGAGAEEGRRQGHRGHHQRQGCARHPRRESRRGYAALPDRAHGGAGAAHPRPGAAARRSRRRLVRANRDRHRHRDRARVGALRARAALRLRGGQRRGGAHHRVPLRARPGDTDLDHRRHGTGRAERHPLPQRRGSGEAARGEHAGGGQDRHAHARQAATRGFRDRGRNPGEGRAGADREPRARKRASPRPGDRHGRRKPGRAACAGEKLRIRYRPGRARYRRGSPGRRRKPPLHGGAGWCSAVTRGEGRSVARSRQDRALRGHRRPHRRGDRRRRSDQGDDARSDQGARRRGCARGDALGGFTQDRRSGRPATRHRGSDRGGAARAEVGHHPVAAGPRPRGRHGGRRDQRRARRWRRPTSGSRWAPAPTSRSRARASRW